MRLLGSTSTSSIPGGAGSRRRARFVTTSCQLAPWTRRRRSLLASSLAWPACARRSRRSKGRRHCSCVCRGRQWPADWRAERRPGRRSRPPIRSLPGAPAPRPVSRRSSLPRPRRMRCFSSSTNSVRSYGVGGDLLDQLLGELEFGLTHGGQLTPPGRPASAPPRRRGAAAAPSRLLRRKSGRRIP